MNLTHDSLCTACAPSCWAFWHWQRRWVGTFSEFGACSPAKRSLFGQDHFAVIKPSVDSSGNYHHQNPSSSPQQLHKFISYKSGFFGSPTNLQLFLPPKKTPQPPSPHPPSSAPQTGPSTFRGACHGRPGSARRSRRGRLRGAGRGALLLGHGQAGAGGGAESSRAKCWSGYRLYWTLFQFIG